MSLLMYKSGDRVIVRPDLKTGVEYQMTSGNSIWGGGYEWWRASQTMTDLAGQTVTIDQCCYFLPTENQTSYYTIAEFPNDDGEVFGDNWSCWTDEMFSGYAEEGQSAEANVDEQSLLRLFGV